jgi:hypothetical protein
MHMSNHKPMCWIINLLVVIGGLNWGLVGLGGFLGKDLNVVHMLLGAWPTVEWIVYLLVGISAIAKGVFFVTKCDNCPCMAKK